MLIVLNACTIDGCITCCVVVAKSVTQCEDVIVRPLSTVGYTSVATSVIHSRQWAN